MPKLSELSIADLKAAYDYLELQVSSLEMQTQQDPTGGLSDTLGRCRTTHYKIQRELDRRIEDFESGVK